MKIALSLALEPEDAHTGVRLHLGTKTLELTATHASAHVDVDEFDHELIDEAPPAGSTEEST